MSLNDLKPTNSKRARECSVNAFKRFIEDESVALSAIDSAVRGDTSGATLIAVMDRFGVYLAHLKARDGKALKRNTVGQYFRQTKLWILERYPELTRRVDNAILTKGRILERYAGLRPGGKTVKQAAACTKQDLHCIMNHLYATATTLVEYQDASLLTMLWYLFGRASDLASMTKQSLSVCGDNVLFVRFVRMKTSEEQGLTLFPDDSPTTCPITALAIALVLQSIPSNQLLPHLPIPTGSDIEVHGQLVPLSSVLSGATVGRSLLDEVSDDAVVGDLGTDEATSAPEKSASSTPGIHAYVNRVLSRISTSAKVTNDLTSHSFRRGGAQHVNGKAGISPHWIADRGGWNMSTTNKVFSYIFNTTEEDQKVAKILSGHPSEQPLVTLDLSQFDSTTRAKLTMLQDDLFANCTGLHDSDLNVSNKVLDMMMAYLLKGIPHHRSLHPTSPLVRRIELGMTRVGVTLDEVLAWSVHLSTVGAKSTTTDDKSYTKELQMIKNQSAIIDQLIDVTKSQAARLRAIEAKVGVDTEGQHPAIPNKRPPQHEIDPTPTKRRKRKVTALWETWYEWFACHAYLSETDRQWKSTMRRCVAYMLLFVGSLDMDESADDFRDTVLATGKQVATKVHQFLLDHAITCGATGAVEKKFRDLHKTGRLNALIAEYDSRVRMGLVTDPTPPCHRPERLLPVVNATATMPEE